MDKFQLEILNFPDTQALSSVHTTKTDVLPHGVTAGLQSTRVYLLFFPWEESVIPIHGL